ncbi:MAG: bifunctional folylpolyglutamate synthase/dihydrofolate synthase [Candidatus Melainabacteria bacterium]|nr:bifunctional folylpolyglutamate synthase/dihydrofolate synthase [Candidatus Melainabacteria bacterium]
MNYQAALAFIQSFPDMERATFGARGPTMGLPSMKSLLARMGNPHLKARTIHITGSKGKGSTAAFINSILVKAGCRTAMFTSPHLHQYTERYAFGLEAISEEDFARAIGEIQPMVQAEVEAGNDTISTFGILCAAFFHMVASSPLKIDWQIVEVGLGGRYDVTNVFDSKEAAVITPISLEHVELLGSTQTEIAANKAGIVTNGCITVLAPQKDGGARTAVGRRCHEVDSELIDVGKRYKCKILSQDFSGETFAMDGNGLSLEAHIATLGAHQVTNALTAAATVIALRDRAMVQADNDVIREGLGQAAFWGRMEILQQEPDQPLVVADGAHNHESAQALCSAIKAFRADKPSPDCYFVIGVNNDKNISAIWKELTALNKTVIATKSENPRSMDPAQIAELLSVFELDNPKVMTAPTVAQALDRVLKLAGPDDLICVTGSLYVVAEAREYFMGGEKARASAGVFSQKT